MQILCALFCHRGLQNVRRAEGWMLKKRKFDNWAEVAGGKIRPMFAFSTKIIIFVSEKYGIRRNTRPPMPV